MLFRSAVIDGLLEGTRKDLENGIALLNQVADLQKYVDAQTGELDAKQAALAALAPLYPFWPKAEG